MEEVNLVDICCGLAWGDEAKGKITSELASSQKYDFVFRWAGGDNAGHTIYIGDKKYETHIIPSGIFYNINSVIGPDCVVNVEGFLNEVNYLQENGFNIDLIKISPKAHVVFDHHIEEDICKFSKTLGTTNNGIGPCYKDKYQRTGKRLQEHINESFSP